MAPYRFISALSVLSLALVAPLSSASPLPEVTTGDAVPPYPTPVLFTTEILPLDYHVLPSSPLSALAYPDELPVDFNAQRAWGDEDFGIISGASTPHSEMDFSMIEIPAEVAPAAETELKLSETKHTSKGIWADLLRTFSNFRTPSTAPSVADKHDTPAPSIPELDFGPAFDEKDITDALFSGFSKRDLTTSATLGSHPSGSEKAKRDLSSEDTGPVAVIAPHTSVHLPPQPLIQLSLATIAKLNRNIQFTNPFKHSAHTTMAIIGTPFSPSASAYNRAIPHQEEPVLQDTGSRSWIPRDGVLAGLSDADLLYLSLLAVSGMVLCPMAVWVRRRNIARRRAALPRFAEKQG